MVKTENFYKLGPKFCTSPRFLGREAGANRGYGPRIGIALMLLMDPKNVIASDPQVVQNI